MQRELDIVHTEGDVDVLVGGIVRCLDGGDVLENALEHIIDHRVAQILAHVECSLPDDLMKLRLPPLILQPIVENAVRHGFVSVDDRRVDICIRQDDERAYIRVSDRGHGFPPEVLRKLEDPNDPTYTGLFNVRKRLRSIYGEQCSFTIGSSERGSTVAFSIPLIPPQMPDTV